MDNNSETDLNKKGEIKSTKDEEKGETAFKKYLSVINDDTESVFQTLYNVLREPFVKLIIVITIIIINGLVFSYYGTPNGFRSLVAEGTLALAFVTYLQMKRSENKVVK